MFQGWKLHLPGTAGAFMGLSGALASFQGLAVPLPQLYVSSNGHHLVTADNQPFFWQADTAWSLDEISPTAVTQYFADRASRGYNVIQGPIVIADNEDGTALSPKFNPATDPDVAPDFPSCPLSGEIFPLDGTVVREVDPIPGTWNACYLSFLDYIVQQAENHGLYLVIPVTWGPQADKVFSKSDPSVAQDRYRELSARCAAKTHVMWIGVGEFHKIFRPAVNGGESFLTKDYVEMCFPGEMALLRAMATGLEQGHGGMHLMTMHPTGSRSSSLYFHNEGWLDFNMNQTGAISASDYADIRTDYNLTPAKPTIDGEPGYEGGASGTITAHQVRYSAYEGVFTGAFGHTYGNATVWEFNPGWESALGAEGGTQMIHLRRLVESRPMLARAPKAVVAGNPTSESTAYADMKRVVATGSADTLAVYFPRETESRTITLTGVSGETLNAWWFNPRDGKTYKEDGTTATTTPFLTLTKKKTKSLKKSFDPPGASADRDWVLVVDNAAARFSVPGVPAGQAAGFPGQ